jgi:hypothetical protein
MNARRFTTISVLVTLVGIGLFTWLLYGFPDRLVPTDPPPTVGEYALRCAVCVFSWPTVIIAWLFGEPGGHAIFLLFIPSGLVWAGLVELFFKIRQPRRANPAAPGNGAIAHLLHFKRLRRAVPEQQRWVY